jgi:Natural resistance-associated macrophage protein
VLLLLVPVLIVNQEMMVVRLGAVTGVGHAKLTNERFGRFWGWFSVGDLFLLNFLTIVTEFIGVSLAHVRSARNAGVEKRPLSAVETVAGERRRPRRRTQQRLPLRLGDAALWRRLPAGRLHR